MKLQILVPQYKETDAEILPLLNSIAIQQHVNFDQFGVIICNDGSDVYLSEELLASFPFAIEYHKEPHRGVSGTRNACLDYATADYVMFCDADDMFYNVCGLYLIGRYIIEGFDVLTSLFYEETRREETNEPVYVKRENDATFVHGKVLRRQYLIDKGIRWNENLTIHEDSYFNVLAKSLAGNEKYCKDAFYLWKWRDDSVCRTDPNYMLNTYTNLIDSNDALISELIKRGRMDTAMYLLAYFIFETYYTMNKPDWVSLENQQYRAKAEERFAEYYAKWKSLWDEIPDVDKVNISKTTREKVLAEGMLIESITIFDWLNKEINHVNKKTEKETS